MLIKPITKVFGIHFDLSLEEAVLFISDARTMQHEVKTMLKASGIDPETGDSTHILIKMDQDEKSKRATTSKPKEPCPYCGKEYIRLSTHMPKCPDNPDNTILPEEPAIIYSPNQA